MNNIDQDTVDSFGNEWERFDQSGMTENEVLKISKDYFDIFPWEKLGTDSTGFDMGCGSGRWAQYVAPKVGHLNCIDPSSAISIAKKKLRNFNNVTFIHGSVSSNSLTKSSQDFGYSLGVLHHVPDTQAAIESCVDLLKPGAPLLLYLYYDFENRTKLFYLMWKASNFFRKVISKMPQFMKNIVTDIIAIIIYLPLSLTARFVDKCRLNSTNIPLSYYKDKSFYTMRTDSRDRFGTPLEQRFSRSKIHKKMSNAGIKGITFSKSPPFWCVVGFKEGK